MSSGITSRTHGQNMTDALVKIRIQALKELKEAAYDLGCNAVIGVDFDYLTLEPEREALFMAKNDDLSAILLEILDHITDGKSYSYSAKFPSIGAAPQV